MPICLPSLLVVPRTEVNHLARTLLALLTIPPSLTKHLSRPNRLFAAPIVRALSLFLLPLHRRLVQNIVLLPLSSIELPVDEHLTLPLTRRRLSRSTNRTQTPSSLSRLLLVARSHFVSLLLVVHLAPESLANSASRLTILISLCWDPSRNRTGPLFCL